MSDEIWNNDLVQFARLISELQAAGAFTPEIMHELRDSMDLPFDRIDELISRADKVFENSKKGVYTQIDAPVKFISYDGEYPCLCMGSLVVDIGGTIWKFPKYSLSSGGHVSADADWNWDVQHGSWKIDTWPEGFPECKKKETLDVLNSEVSGGCCGGCI